MSQWDADQSTFVTASAASSTLASENTGRREITVVNTHATQDAYLQLPTSRGAVNAAVVGQGIYLKAAGGSWTSNTWKGVVTCIATGAATVLTVVEF